MIDPTVVKTLAIFCPIAAQTALGYCFERPALPDYHHRLLQPMMPLSFDLIVDCNRDFVFLEDNTEYLVLEFVRD